MKDYFKKLKYLFKWRDMVFTLVIFALILGIALLTSDSLVEITFGETAVDVVSKRYTMNIPYDMIDHVELSERIEDSELIKGKGEIAMQTGVWTNEVWGEHYACLDLDAKNCIVVHLNDGRIFVFSRDDDETTSEDFEKLQQHLNNQ